MAKKYFVTTNPDIVPVSGFAIGRDSFMYEMEASEFESMAKQYNSGTFVILTKEEFDAEKKSQSSGGLPTELTQIQPPLAPPVEQEEVEEEEVLKVSKVKAPEPPAKPKKGKS